MYELGKDTNIESIATPEKLNRESFIILASTFKTCLFGKCRGSLGTLAGTGVWKESYTANVRA